MLGRLAARLRVGVPRGHVPHRVPAHRGDLAREAVVAHRVRTVRRDLGVQDRVAAGGLGRLDGDAGLFEQAPDAFGAARRADVGELVEPRERELHESLANWDRKRSSPSKSRRRSGKPYFRSATRSIPRPKAKPVYSSGSIATPWRTLGWTMPAPMISIQPEPLHLPQPAPPQKMQLIETS